MLNETFSVIFKHCLFIPNWLISDLYHILHHHHHHMPSSASHGTLRPHCSTFVGGGPTNSSTDVLTLSASTLSKPILRSSADNLLQNQNQQQSMVRLRGWSHLLMEKLNSTEIVGKWFPWKLWKIETNINGGKLKLIKKKCGKLNSIKVKNWIP